MFFPFINYTTVSWEIIDTGGSPDIVTTVSGKSFVVIEIDGASGSTTINGRFFWERNAIDVDIFSATGSVGSTTFSTSGSIVPDGEEIRAEFTESGTQTATIHIFQLPENP